MICNCYLINSLANFNTSESSTRRWYSPCDARTSIKHCCLPFFFNERTSHQSTQHILRKEKDLIACMGKIAASVFLKLFIHGIDKGHSIAEFFYKCKQHKSMILKDQKMLSHSHSGPLNYRKHNICSPQLTGVPFVEGNSAKLTICHIRIIFNVFDQCLLLV